MATPVKNLVSNVKRLLDMNNASEALIAANDIDALNLNEVVEGTLVNAARYIETNAPAYLVDGLAILSNTTTTSDDEEVSLLSMEAGTEQLAPGSGSSAEETSTDVTLAGVEMNNGLYKVSVALPTDFLRLLVFKLRGWDRPGDIITEQDPRYALQSSKYGLTGSPEAPLVAIVNGVDGKLKLEAYSATSATPAMEKGLYVPLRSISGNTLDTKTIVISEKLQAAIEYYAAYLTCLTYGNANLATYMLNQAHVLAEIPVAQTNKE